MYFPAGTAGKYKGISLEKSRIGHAAECGPSGIDKWKRMIYNFQDKGKDVFKLVLRDVFAFLHTIFA